jgi:hypothetical protein
MHRVHHLFVFTKSFHELIGLGCSWTGLEDVDLRLKSADGVVWEVVF